MATAATSTMDAYPPRPWWRRVPFLSITPRPPLSNFDNPTISPEASANPLSVLTFFWLDPLLRRGYTRPLDKDDLWSLPDSRSANAYATRLEANWNRRVQEANRINDQRRPSSASLLDDIAAYKASTQRGSSPFSACLRRVPFLGSKKQRSIPKAEPSLVMAMNDTVLFYFWSGGFMKLLADVATITSPLLLRAITNFVSESYASKQNSTQAPSLGKGVAMAIGLFLIQATIVFLNVHSFYRSFGTGILLRSALIHATYRRAMRLSNKSRTTGGLGVSKIVSLISADVSRIDFCCQYFHMAWTSIVQIIICLALLIYSLGYSALPGFACIVVLSPVQTVLTKHLFLLRKRSMKWTDRRIKAVSELMGGIRLIKQFAWEIPYIARITGYRKTELAFLRKRLLFRSLNISTSFATPTLAAVVSFVTYAGTGHDISQPGMAGIIFSSLTFFQLLRTPLQFLPVSWNAIADAKNAAKRIEAVFTAETREVGPRVDRSLSCALRVERASFEWDSPAADPTLKMSVKPNPAPSTNLGQPLPAGQTPASVGKNGTFCVEDISLAVPRGQLIAVVGGIGSGKSSLINALAGEMRLTSGSVTFGGSVGMCAQTAWILSTSIRENILFGRPFDQAKYDRVVRDCCLEPDFAMLPDGDATIVGEKGVSLSGGQRQRVNIARAVYHDDDVILFDDCFSALDAHVGEAVFRNVMLGSLASKTRILATHALHLLSSVDYIITLTDGRIAEQGTYHRLIKRKGAFADFIDMYGGALSAEKRLRVVEEEQGVGPKEEDDAAGDDEVITSPPKAVRDQRAQLASEMEQRQALPKTEEGQAAASSSEAAISKAPTAPAPGKAIMQLEERTTGSVTRRTYADYFGSANLALLLPLFVAAVLVFQGSTVMSPLWLLWWQQRKFASVPTGVYMGVYAILGCTQALGLLSMGAVFALFTFYSSMSIHLRALRRVVYAPVSFFDTTPLGRITHRFSKDVDVVDNIIGDAIRTFLGTVVQVIGSVVLIAYLTPYFLIAVGVLIFAYFWTGLFYRASSRELRRLDAVLRSNMYEHLSESLTGLSTIRAYGETATFELENGRRMDNENRAYWLSMACQRWLSIRLDFFGSLLVLAVALLAVFTRFTIQPGETGAALSYILTAQSVFSWMIRQSAEIENNMNAVERLLYYARSVEQEPEHVVPKEDDQVDPAWPSKGHVRFEDVVVSHRAGLEPVLKGVSFEVQPGQHVAICGRTGAGKSTMVSTLLRMMELNSGRIIVDDVDISKIGLQLLRSRLSIIPQDALLFSGTLRYNLDPLGEHEDVDLYDAMRRACLLDRGAKDFGDKTADADADDDFDGFATPQSNVDDNDDDDDETLAASRRSSLEASKIRRNASAATSSRTLDGGSDEDDGVKGGESQGLTLDSVIEEEGSNLSVGQRSLISMARALVRHSRVCILDEATASIDYGTDRAVQRSISRDLAGRTVICIAHRLATIVGFDVVCVLDAGRVLEVGSPADLWERPEGAFRKMCESSGIGREEVNQARKRELRLREKGLRGPRRGGESNL